MKSKVDLILARAALIYHDTKCQNHDDLFITSFIPWSWFCVQQEPTGVGSLQRFQSIETGNGRPRSLPDVQRALFACFSFSFCPIAGLQLSIRKLMIIGTASFLSTS